MRPRDTLLATLTTLAFTATTALAQTGFSAVLTGAAEVPPVASTVTGTGTFILNGSDLQFSLQFSGLQGNFSVSHLHGPAPTTGNAGVLFNWAVSPFITLNPDMRGGTIIGTWTGIRVVNLASLNAGLLYANVHSGFAAGGEIRRQIMPDQTVPTTSTSWARIKSLYR